MVNEILKNGVSTGLRAALKAYVQGGWVADINTGEMAPGNKVTPTNTEIVERKMIDAVKQVAVDTFTMDKEERLRLLKEQIHIPTAVTVKIIGEYWVMPYIHKPTPPMVDPVEIERHIAEKRV